MSSDIDFSQYMRKSGANSFQQTQEQDTDFSQFMRKPERTGMQKAGRLAMQAGLSTAERGLIPYEMAVAPLASQGAQHAEYRKNIFEDIERLQEQKLAGQWDEQDQKLYDSLVEQIKRPEIAAKNVKTADIGIRGLFEKATGVETHPEGVLEKGVSWTAFLKNPKNAKDLLKSGINPKELLKTIIPGQKSLRGLTAGTALELAEEKKLGPLGTMTAAIVGDVAGAGAKGFVKGLLNPKQTLAQGAALLANRKSVIKKELADASKGKEFTKDIGTLTDNRIVQMIQARLSASGLTGKPLEDLRKTMIKEITNEYEAIANELGEARFDTLMEAGEVGKEAITEIRNAEKARIGAAYEAATKRLTNVSVVNPVKLVSKINKLKSALAPGSVKSQEQKAVLEIIGTLEKDLVDSSGQLKPAKVQDLINNKIALNDIINYEVQGGQKQLLKGLVSEIDKLILSHGAKDKQFLKMYVQANKDFSKHAKDFRNENINKILLSRDPSTLINKMNSAQGIRDLRTALSYSPEGKKVFNDLARKKMDMIFGINAKEGLGDQLKLGKFSNLLEKGKNRELMKELLGKEGFARLERLQNHAGELAETAQKFFNASQSATAAADLGAIGSALMAFFGAITGNPFALTAAGAIGGANIVSRIIANPEFLKLTEEAIAAAKKNDIGLMTRIANEMNPLLKESGIGAIAQEQR